MDRVLRHKNKSVIKDVNDAFSCFLTPELRRAAERRPLNELLGLLETGLSVDCTDY